VTQDATIDAENSRKKSIANVAIDEKLRPCKDTTPMSEYIGGKACTTI
jgi:hypothetical protein